MDLTIYWVPIACRLMALQDHLSTALAKAVRTTGSQSAFARLIQKDQSTVHDWLRTGKLLPAECVLAVESATGISRHDLRPDIYPIENSGPHSPEAAPAASSELYVAGVRTSPLAGARS